MTDDRNRPAENIPLDEPPMEEWPPKEWAEADEARDPERGRHIIWVLFAALVFLVGWYLF